MPKPHLTAASIIDLRSELARRQSRAGSLVRRRDELLAKASRIDEELAALGVPGGSRQRRGRPASATRPARGRRKSRRSGPTLGNTLASVLDGKVMTVTDAVDAIRKAGFKTKASARGLYSMVAIALAKSGRFKRVARGKYKAR